MFTTNVFLNIWSSIHRLLGSHVDSIIIFAMLARHDVHSAIAKNMEMVVNRSESHTVNITSKELPIFFYLYVVL